MRVFVSEYVCSGAWPEPVLSPSLAREGRAMLLSLLSDVAALPGITVCTTWDVRLGPFPLRSGIAGGSPLDIECRAVGSPHDERCVFDRLAAECDATYVIAPELDDLLTQRVRSVLDAGGRSLNSSLDALAACSDKWETFQRLTHSGIATVPSVRFEAGAESAQFAFPMVIKPRFGAGSQNTLLVRSLDELHSAEVLFSTDRQTSEAILQPFVAGRSLSVAGVFRSNGTLREAWPVGEQRLSGDGRFAYIGGQVGRGICDFRFSIFDFVERVAAAVPGLRGYIGFDLIAPDGPDAAPVIVDINPRLTTSYLGYRALSRTNLAGRILWPDEPWPEPDWSNGPVEFDAGGQIRIRNGD